MQFIRAFRHIIQVCILLCVTVYVSATDDEFYVFYIGLQLYYVYNRYSSAGIINGHF